MERFILPRVGMEKACRHLYEAISHIARIVIRQRPECCCSHFLLFCFLFHLEPRSMEWCYPNSGCQGSLGTPFQTYPDICPLVDFKSYQVVKINHCRGQGDGWSVTCLPCEQNSRCLDPRPPHKRLDYYAQQHTPNPYIGEAEAGGFPGLAAANLVKLMSSRFCHRLSQYIKQKALKTAPDIDFHTHIYAHLPTYTNKSTQIQVPSYICCTNRHRQ